MDEAVSDDAGEDGRRLELVRPANDLDDDPDLGVTIFRVRPFDAPGPPAAPPPQAAPPMRDFGPLPGQQRPLLLGPGITLEAKVRDVTLLVIEGHMTCEAAKVQDLIVAEAGSFHGAIEAETAEIAGRLEGFVATRGSLILRATGSILGRARCRRLLVEEGALLSGEVEMTSPAAPAGTT